MIHYNSIISFRSFFPFCITHDIALYFYSVLSEIIKKKIESKSGIKIRYGRDCIALSEKIFKDCNLKLSAMTLKRLYSFVKGASGVRAYTLDVLSNYLGFSTWDDLIEPLEYEGWA